MLRVFALLGSCLLLLAPGCATSRAESYTKPGYDFTKINRIAVVEVTATKLAPESRNAIGDDFSMQLLKKGYDVIERSQIDKALQELDFQNSGATTEADRQKVGKVLNVPAIIVVNLPQLGEQISMTAKMIEVETGTILWQGEGTGNMKSGAGSILGGLGGAVAGGVAGDAMGSATAGAVVGGVAGATAGYVMQPDEMEQAKKVVVEVCEGLPRR